jgi:hypothetical protein
MLVKGTHFTARLPPDWTEDQSGTSGGGLRFVDPRYREAVFGVHRFDARPGTSIDDALRDLAGRKELIARANGATYVSAPRRETGTRLAVSFTGVVARPDATVVMLEALVTHPDPVDGPHFIVSFGCYEYWPQARAPEGPPNSDASLAFARGVLDTIQITPNRTSP